MPGGLFFDGVHIHCCGNGHLWFRSYSESLWKSPKVTKGLLPRHSVPRLGSACPHSSIAPGARRHRPSMAGGGYRGIPAAVPPTQRLRSASGKGASRSGSKAKTTATATATATATPDQRQINGRSTASRAGSLPPSEWVHPGKDWSADRPPSQRCGDPTSQLPQKIRAHPPCLSPLNRPSVSSPAAIDLDAPPPREAEWRFCAVGNPAWMPG